jgi:hypothetical protein
MDDNGGRGADARRPPTRTDLTTIEKQEPVGTSQSMDELTQPVPAHPIRNGHLTYVTVTVGGKPFLSMSSPKNVSVSGQECTKDDCTGSMKPFSITVLDTGIALVVVSANETLKKTTNPQHHIYSTPSHSKIDTVTVNSTAYPITGTGEVKVEVSYHHP